MSTEAINRSRDAVSAEDRDERARAAVKAFRSMQFGLTTYARAITRNPKVRVQVSSGPPRTDGNIIFYRPPIRLGDKTKHDRAVCDLRDEQTGLLKCAACAIREEVLVNIYHEIAHIAFGSFATTTDKARRDALYLAVKEWGSDYADRIEKRIKTAPSDMTKNYMSLSGLISPFLPHLLNALEDARVDTAMFKARRGVKKMLMADTYSLLRDGLGYEDELIKWSDAPLNAQAALACYLSAADYQGWQEYLHPQIGEHFADEKLQHLLDSVRNARDAADTYAASFPILARLRELGYMLMPEEKPEETPDQEDDSDGDSGDDGGQGEEETSGDSESGEVDEQPAEPGDPSRGDSDVPDSGDQGETESAEGSGDSGPVSGVSDDDGDSGQSGPDDKEADSDESKGGDEDLDIGDSDSEPGQGDSEGSEEEEERTPGDGSGPGGQTEGESGESEVLRDRHESSGTADDIDESESSESAGDEVSSREVDTGHEDGSPDAEAGQEGNQERSQEGQGPESEVDGGNADAGEDYSDDERQREGDEPQEEEPEVIDSGADKGEGGVEVPNHGDHYDVEQAMEKIEESHADATEAHVAESDDDKAIKVAVIQGIYFETPSANVDEINEHHGTGDVWDVYNELSHGDRVRVGVECDCDVPESILGPSLLRLRRAFNDNQTSVMERHKKSGRVDAAVLGRRAWSGDARLFHKKRIPGKKDYAVLIGIDISSSTLGNNLALAKRAAYAQAELCDRLGVKFAVFAHYALFNGSGQRRAYSMEICHIKDFDSPWNTQAQERLTKICGAGGNLDGHTMEYYRKQLDEVDATDKILMYYTDGKMPAANKVEELEVLQREIRVCRQKRYTLLGVGIRTDSPKQHGLDTVQVDDDDDLRAVVEHLGKRLTAESVR